jgi:hypothetical protein
MARIINDATFYNTSSKSTNTIITSNRTMGRNIGEFVEFLEQKEKTNSCFFLKLVLMGVVGFKRKSFILFEKSFTLE